MLPIKIKAHLEKRFGKRYLTFGRDRIIEYLMDYDTFENVMKCFGRNRITKVIFNMMDGDPIINFITDSNIRRIKKTILSDNSKNYHDYFTTFNFRTDHVMYDLIVEVNYRYVYD